MIQWLRSTCLTAQCPVRKLLKSEPVAFPNICTFRDFVVADR
jgi:hypothetical protein